MLKYDVTMIDPDPKVNKSKLKLQRLIRTYLTNEYMHQMLT